ncbi:MAG: ABC transporter permease [Lachnospiraceae bacterium]|nr:ABC transporter permease [Lachnospiraceae bacterium]
MGKYVRNALILAGVLCLFLFALAYLGIANDPDTGVPDAAPGNEVISPSIELFTSMSYLVFTCVMLSSFIVSAYRNKTMALMFSYPVKRQKVLISQMLAVWIYFMVSSFPIDFNMAGLSFYIQLIVKSIVIVTMSFIALFIGIAMKSSKATIVSSFLLIFLTQANIGDLTLADNVVFPVILTVISLLFAFLSIYKAETNDLM